MMFHRGIGLVLVGTAVTASAGDLASADERDRPRPTVQFNRDIRPILSDKCFRCHGPDVATRQGDLRLDEAARVFQDRGGYRVVVPGDPEASELYRRIVTEDEAERMPPAGSGRSLSPQERNLLKRWIDEGAEYESHWSFLTPQRPALPQVERKAWPTNPIDYFVLARLEREGLQPSPEADRRALIRRVTFDLTGLPPTPQEVQAFVADASPQAYEKVVDRLLASARFGERMALEWLDTARYADTHGYLFDTERSMWRWRDWVIESFNRNQPFDQFTVEQLAGDLLPDPTLAQQIATGFNRNHTINNEAGAIAAEYYVENIVDRVNTTATAWMGLTVACAQCHDHKYDPITQREYYQLYAFFNNVPELGLDGFNSNAKPLLKAPTTEQTRQSAELERQVAAAQETFAPLAAMFGPAQAAWEREFYQPVEPMSDGLAAYLPLDGNTDNAATSDRPAEVRDGMLTCEAGLFGDSMALDGQRYVDLGNVGDFDTSNAFSLGAWIYPVSIEGRPSIFSRMEPDMSFRGYSLQLNQGRLTLVLVNEYPGDMLMVQTKQAIEPYQWQHVLAVYDGSAKAAGVRLYVNGALQAVDVTTDSLASSIRCGKPLLIGNGASGKFRGRVDEVRVYDRALSEGDIPRLPGLSIHSLIAVTENARNDEQTERIRNYYLKHGAPAEWREPYERLVVLRKSRKEAERSVPTVMVMSELDKPRETRMLIRGAYDRPGDAVVAATPASLPPMRDDLPRNRLGLARWLTDPRHPLTARVTVNRYWQMYFGIGLVRTTENFGLQGGWPSHPELLDWLATEFVESGWNVKAMQRLIVTSAAYRQSSKATGRLLEVDPQNHLLARGPRHRLQAEFIRDLALAVSGLLMERQGGPSVKPYMPAELWREVAFDVTGKTLTAQVYEQDQGEALFRRSMYTFWKRTAPPPTMLIFDGPDRERCVVRREPTNTPLQALVVMNEPTYVEASRKLAERMLIEAGNDPADRIAWGFELTTGRRPSQAELAPLKALLAEQLGRFAADAEGAKALLSTGESSRNESLPMSQLAAYTLIANVLLNLDETLTKG